MRVRETFYRGAELVRMPSAMPARTYNLTRILLARSRDSFVFVPIRSMQYLAIITRDEIVFVDSLAYACRENEGGRLIMLAWKFDTDTQRGALDQPHPCRIVYYTQDGGQLQLRLVSAYREALELMDRRYRNRALPAGGARIVPLKQT